MADEHIGLRTGPHTWLTAEELTMPEVTVTPESTPRPDADTVAEQPDPFSGLGRGGPQTPEDAYRQSHVEHTALQSFAELADVSVPDLPPLTPVPVWGPGSAAAQAMDAADGRGGGGRVRDDSDPGAGSQQPGSAVDLPELDGVGPIDQFGAGDVPTVPSDVGGAADDGTETDIDG